MAVPGPEQFRLLRHDLDLGHGPFPLLPRTQGTLEGADIQFDQQFHRPFPLIKLEAQKDRLAAQQVRQGRRVRRDSAAKMLRVNGI